MHVCLFVYFSTVYFYRDDLSVLIHKLCVFALQNLTHKDVCFSFIFYIRNVRAGVLESLAMMPHVFWIPNVHVQPRPFLQHSRFWTLPRWYELPGVVQCSITQGFFFANKMNLLSSRIWHTFNYRFSCYIVIMKVFLMWMVLLVGSRTMWTVVIEYFWFVSRVGHHRIPHPDATHIHAEHIDMGFQSYFFSPCGYVSSCLHSCTELHQWQYWEC